MAAFNGYTDTFSHVQVVVDFDGSGKVLARSSARGLSLVGYEEDSDKVRAFLEVAFVLLLVALLVREAAEARVALQEKRGWEHLTSASVIFSVSGAFLNLALMAMWIYVVFGVSSTFEMKGTFEVYVDLEKRARPFTLARGGAGLHEARDAIAELERAIDFFDTYQAIHGFVFLLVVARIVRACHFQPRLGIITRTLSAAASDLAHYGAVLGTVFFACSIVSYALLGGHAEQFSTFGHAVHVNFNMLAFQVGGRWGLRPKTLSLSLCSLL